ncbi:CRM-domain containing factor CFM3, chloroplastic/mitochondrial [Actinidia eriantha]|uniref:CRM-domain containing factor CFM3, chloroplastic/mitochondrial n=1 Tax=Actinidia eriantha TaxID=165200 RepID=UPI00258464CE|nr:CRM-domain containing factor CFM3, chloroplastic/mitochondrial [Actinidia eriantha]XP_057485565.1 CRM-domain containing factor CFM3, chloroplastic/mitochondrial [Actinidia eriantha]XP_057485566.1 CRM-domain containing factor CFM3, chloroplastic/mitochondrial [Actinidia eriantha]
MAFSGAKLTEMPLRSKLPLSSHSPPSLHLRFLFSRKPPLSPLKPYSSLRSNHRFQKPQNPNPNLPPKSKPWLNKWPPPNPPPSELNFRRDENRVENRYFDGKAGAGTNAIERIVLRLRNLGLGLDEEERENEGEEEDSEMPVTGEEKLGDLLARDWARPDKILVEGNGDEDETVFPWERVEEDEERESVEEVRKKRAVRAPTLAELTIEDEELRRLRREGMTLRERISVPKAGVTGAVLEKIYDQWRKSELVRLKFHESLAHDMKTAHEIVERRTGGLVTWRSGSVMVVFRGSNYEGPGQRPNMAEREDDSLFVPDVSKADNSIDSIVNGSPSILEKSRLPASDHVESMTEEEAEYNSLLDGLGPRFEDWWGTGILPVDADLLPQTIPGYKTPFRLLPTGMRSRLTNAELTNLRKIAKSLPCHFALGRNRNHQGLAAAIIKLWEKSLVAKIAVKRGIQNTNNKLMAEEIKNLTGGILLLRNKFFIVIYRGKDFLPTNVAAALAERQEMTKQIQDVEEKVRNGTVEASLMVEDGQAQAGTLAEFYEAQARWGREMSAEEREKMIGKASRIDHARKVKRMEHKLRIAQNKLHRSERMLSKVEASMVPVGPSDDQETITEEERTMFRRVGLRMKPYLPVGIRGVFDGVIENMHLHWKHRELVKLISKQKNLAFIEETARLLEYESGGILVSIERVPKGHALIYYRGKNYRRPISLRPRNLLTKAKALKRSVGMQRHEALSQHISELEKTIDQMTIEMGDCENVQDKNTNGGYDKFDRVLEFSESEDETSWSDGDEEHLGWEDEESKA